MAETTITRWLFEIDDGGESWFYIVDTAEQAIAEHVRMNYTEAGVPLDDQDEPFTATAWPDKKLFTFNDNNGDVIEKTAREWCESRPFGMFATTCI